MKIKVLTYNVHKFFNITRRNYFLSQLKELLSKMDLDLVFLQEIRGLQPTKIEEKFNKDPLEHLADELWDHFIYGKNAIYTRGNHGNAILSKYPFLSWENFNISNHKWEKRGFLLGKIEIKGRPISISCTHLDLTAMGRRRQVKKIETLLNKHTKSSDPFIFCGDFNDWNNKTSALVTNLGFECSEITLNKKSATFPSFFPLLELDKIFFRNAKCLTTHVLTDPHWKTLSDHLPLYAEFEI